MLVAEFTSLYERNNLDQKDLNDALDFLSELQAELSSNHLKHQLEDIDINILDELIHYLLLFRKNIVVNFVIMMRYFKVAKRHDLFIHLTRYTGSIGVMESILSKLVRVVGSSKADEIKSSIQIPELGAPLLEMPSYIDKMMSTFEKHLTEKQIKYILADNHHHIPKEAFLQEKVYYEQALTLDDYLSDLHQRNIDELKQFQKENRVWYEQEINDQVIEFVSSNKEILSAVRYDDKLYVTKIPYDTKAYLEASTIEKKRYHACHCPFAKVVLQNDQHHISPEWCNCSGGFTKYQFDILFDKELDVQCLETPLKGDILCRFAISLEGIDYKK